MIEKPILQEIAAASDRDIFSGYYSYFESANRILRSNPDNSICGIYELYNEMEDKDAHLFSVLQTRKLGVLSRSRKILPANNSQKALSVANFVQSVIDRIDNFDEDLFQLLDALAKGFSVLEIIWQVRSGKVTISKLKSRYQGRFCFDSQNNLILLDNTRFPFGVLAYSSHSQSHSAAVISSASSNAAILPQRKFLIFTFNSTNENPYGSGLCCKAYWYYWFKKNNLKFWVIFNEKFGSPTVVGKYKPGTSQEERKKLMEVIESLQNDTGVTIPENVMIEFLEARRTGSINSYKDLADWCNDEISKIVLGETLTTSEGRRSGSLALGKVHENVRNEYIEFDAKSLMGIINNQLIPYIVYFNFGPDVPLPKMIIDTSEDEDPERDISIDKQLINLGLPIPTSYFYEKYKKPIPKNNERILRYDDNNLYQYHLQYGILTINEVRNTLGLPPVPWGDKPPAKIEQGKSIPEPVSEEESSIPSAIGDAKEEILVDDKIIE